MSFFSHRAGMKVHPFVFLASAGLIALFVFIGVTFTEAFDRFATHTQDFIVSHLGWFYILSVGLFLPFVIWLGLSRYGHIRLGKDSDRPEFSYLSWFSMLFSAGMGIGLLFYGVAEPILHYSSPPYGEPQTVEAAKNAILFTFFHWGAHAWAIYIVVGLSLAYFSFRKDCPLTIRSAFYPVLGEKIHGPIGNIIDTLAVVGTMFGVATSLGLGVMQVNAGLSTLLPIDVSTENQLFLIAAITAMATISVVSGLGAGIRRLSEFNLIVAALLLIFVASVGPTDFLLRSFVQNIGRYIQELPQQTTWMDAYYSTGWRGDWTIFYWGWWIAWSPFVGMFIARISRGRTIREFVFGTLLAPTLLTFIWLTVFGNTALHIELFGAGGIVEAVNDSVPKALYVLLDRFPLAILSSTLATIVVITFFVTSSDSGSLVIDIITSGGDQDPPVPQRIFWALSEGLVAAVLLVAGGLAALQTAAITTGLPFCAVLLLMCYSLVKRLRRDPFIKASPQKKDKKAA